MRALITGANGFLGSHLVDHLLAQGDVEVRVLVRATSDTRWLAGKPVERAVGDVTCLPEDLATAVSGVDWVFHAAGLTKAVQKPRLFEVNEGGTANLVRACLRRTTPPERFVLVSSAGAQGPGPGGALLSEDQEPHPVTAYGRSKLAAEVVVRHYAQRLPQTIVRPGGIYGPRDFELLPAFQAVKRGLALRLGRKVHNVNMAFAADIARALSLAARSGQTEGETLLVGGPNAAQGEVVEAVVRAMGAKRVLRLSAPAPAVRLAAGLSSLVGRITGKPRIFTWDNADRLLAKSWAFDLGKAERLLGYAPEWDLDRGLAATVAWYRDQGLI